MLRGDLSNETATRVGIRFEAVIYNFGKLNQPGKGLAESILQKDCNLYFFSLLEERKIRAWCWKWGIMYTNIITATSLIELVDLCLAHKLSLYIDTDDRLLEQITARGNPRIETRKWQQSV